MGDMDFGIDLPTINAITSQLVSVHNAGIKISLSTLDAPNDTENNGYELHRSLLESKLVYI